MLVALAHKQLHTVISIDNLPVSSLYRRKENKGNVLISVGSKQIYALELNLECVIITFDQGFLVFNSCCGPL